MDPFPPPGGGFEPRPAESLAPEGSEPLASGLPASSLPPPPAQKKRRRGPLLIGIAVLVVVGVVAAAATTSGGKKATTASSPSPSATTAPRPTAPGSLQAKAGSFQVILSWSPSTGDFIGYRIFRDGSALDVVSAPATTYTDSHALPTSTYSYGVEAYTQGGENSEQAVLRVNTPKAPLSAARLTGVYNVHLKPTSQFGYSETLGPVTDGWRFKPGCAVGACDVAWNELGHRDRGAKLKRSGISYRGSDPSSVTGRCNGVNATGTFEVTIKVTKAGVVRGMWVAIQLEGTVVEKSPAELGCTSSEADYSFTAKFVR